MHNTTIYLKTRNVVFLILITIIICLLSSANFLLYLLGFTHKYVLTFIPISLVVLMVLVRGLDNSYVSLNRHYIHLYVCRKHNVRINISEINTIKFGCKTPNHLTGELLYLSQLSLTDGTIIDITEYVTNTQHLKVISDYILEVCGTSL